MEMEKEKYFLFQFPLMIRNGLNATSFEIMDFNEIFGNYGHS